MKTFLVKAWKPAAWITFYLLSSAFWWNSGRKDSDLWHWQHKPTFTHALIVRPQYDSAGHPCEMYIEKSQVVTIMGDGHVEYNTTAAKVNGCDFHWVTTELGGN